MKQGESVYNFITIVCYKRTNLFEYNDLFAGYFIKNFEFYSKKLGFINNILTTMPEHLHSLINVNADFDLESALRKIKSYTARQIIDSIKANQAKVFKTGYLQYIMKHKEYKELCNLIPKRYSVFIKMKYKEPDKYNGYGKQAYLLDLGLLVSDKNITEPKVLKDNELNIIRRKEFKTKYSRRIVIDVKGVDFLRLLKSNKTGQDYKVFEKDDDIREVDNDFYYNNVVNYIYDNALNRRLVKRAEDYKNLRIYNI